MYYDFLRLFELHLKLRDHAISVFISLSSSISINLYNKT